MGARSIGRHLVAPRPVAAPTITVAEVQALRDEGRQVTQNEEGFVIVDGFRRFKLLGKSRIEPDVESDLTDFGPGLERRPAGEDVITF